MSQRADLLAAVYAQQPLTESWVQAVRRLGAWRKTEHERPKRGRPTGLSRGELFARMLKSHVFDADRQAWRQRWWHFPNAETFDEMKRTLEARKQAEKQAPVAA